MSAGSGAGDDAAIEEEAARAEIERLTAMRGLSLAAEIMKAWQGSAPRAADRTMTQADIAAWLMRDHPGGRRLMPLLRSAVRDSCELLVDAGVLEPGTGYAVSSSGEVGAAAQLALTSRGVALVADGRFGQWAIDYLRDSVEQAHSRSPWDWLQRLGDRRDWQQPPEEDWEQFREPGHPPWS